MASPQQTRIASLWIGSRLTYLERIVIVSFLEKGHPFTLYTLENLDGVPEGVEIRDAREISKPTFEMDPKRIRFTGGVYSDVFRLDLMTQKECIWVDLDAYCVQPFNFDNPFVFGSTRKRRAAPANGVLRLPPSSKTLQMLRAFVHDPNPIPWWWPDRRKADLINKRERGERHGIEEFDWSLSGPTILRRALEITGEVKHIQHKNIFYPVTHITSERLLDPEANRDHIETPMTVSVHFYGITKLRLIARHGGLPPKGSYLADLCTRHSENPEDWPIPLEQGGEEFVSDKTFDRDVLDNA